MTRFPRALLLALLFAAIPAHAVALPDADLAVTNSDMPDPVMAGSNLAYIVTVANNGPTDAASASWSDTLPAGTTFVSLVSPGGWLCTTPAVGASGTVTCNIPSQPVGSAVFTLTLAVAPATVAGTVISNTASATSVTPDPSPGNNSSTATTAVVAAVPVPAAGLPDTGQDTCYNDSAADTVAVTDPASIARDGGSHPRQDCRYGRDAAAAAGVLTKTGAGAKGFDYSKIANDGSVLAAGVALGANPTDWACTRDNITGLTWEVKTTSGLRNMAWTYTWYNSDPATNGGDAGHLGFDTCSGTLSAYSNQCNTANYAAAINAAALCSHTDWRLPTQRELLTLVYADGTSPSIEPTYFPNTQASYFRSASSYVPDPARAWTVDFLDALTDVIGLKTSYYYVRLVRGGPF